VVGLIAVLELAQLPWVLERAEAVSPRASTSWAGSCGRRHLFYPTITSMFLEVAFALGLVWIARSRLAFVALVLTGAGVIATFTRAGLITMTISLACIGAAMFKRHAAWKPKAHADWSRSRSCSWRWCWCRARRKCWWRA
jgi:hypothetical protein